MFVFFAGVTALSCFIAVVVSLNDPPPPPCELLLSLAGQYCLIRKFPVLLIFLLMNLGVLIFTSGILFSQLHLVATETTTLEVLRGQGHHTKCNNRNLCRGLKNIIDFLFTGKTHKRPSGNGNCIEGEHKV